MTIASINNSKPVTIRKTRSKGTFNPDEEPKPISEFLPKAVETFGRLEEEFKSLRAKFDLLKKEISPRVNCLLHEQCTCAFDEEATFADYWRTGVITPRWGICTTEQQEILVNEKHGKWMRMGVPRRIVDATFENYEVHSDSQAKALARVKAYSARGRGFLIMIGANGNGKSHLAAACLKAKGSGDFLTQAELVDKLRASYDKGGKQQMMQVYQTSQLLVIDEIDIALKGDDITPFLYQILAPRYENDLETILTTNEDLDTLKSILGPRVIDRISANYVVATFDWESHRKLLPKRANASKPS